VIVKDEVHNREIATASNLIDLNNVKQNQFESLENSCYKRGINNCNHGISTRNIGIDTYELELCSNDRVKSTLTFCKTIGIDTSDLESHYDYYKQESTKCTKTVSTDTRDLDYLKKVYATSSISVDTTDLQTFVNFNFVALSCHNGVKSEPDTENVDSKSSAFRIKNNQKENRSRAKTKTKPTGVTDDDSSYDRDFKFDDGFDASNNDSSDNEDNDDSKDVIKKEDSEISSIVTRRNGRNKSSSKRESNCNKRFECEVCKATFTRKHSLMVHLCIHSGLRPFSCSGCGKTFSTSGQAQRHARLHQQTMDDIKEDDRSDPGTTQTDSKDQEEENDDSFLETTGESKLECSLCDMNFNNRHSLMQHKRVAHNMMNQPRECLTCGKVFTCASALKCHETVHTGARDFACVTCGKAFPTKTCLKAHEATHIGLKRFVCQTCGKAFAKKDSLKVHNRKHTNERPFSCDICGRAFDRAFTLKNHRLTHTGEKTHMCAICGKAFSTRGALSTHERIRHNTDPDKPKVYKRRARDFEPSVCDQCGKVYSNRGNLRLHKASAHSTEKPFLCTACGRSFAKKYTLQCHARKHSNERPFPCDQCNQSFYRKSTLKTHKLRHTGARPYVCPLNCGKAFTQSSSLSYHVRHHDRPPRATNGKKRKRRKPKLGMDPAPLTLTPLALVGTIPQHQETIAHPPHAPPPPPPTLTFTSYHPNGLPPCVTSQSLAQL
ncbi:hypothetical protein L9F63_013641, partial [Diploptera punctata]